MDDLYSMTVAQLKERLKEKGLPVSGKKAELIARLREEGGEAFVPDEKYEISCEKCRTTLRVPTDYSGRITCPNCMTKSQVSSPLSTDDATNLTSVVSDIQEVGASQHMATSDYDFVAAPDGQIYAVKKSTFTWGDWCIGFFGTGGYFVLSFFLFADVLDAGICCLIMLGGPIAIGGGGFAASKPGISIGAITALVVFSLTFTVGCMIILASLGN